MARKLILRMKKYSIQSQVITLLESGRRYSGLHYERIILILRLPNIDKTKNSSSSIFLSWKKIIWKKCFFEKKGVLAYVFYKSSSGALQSKSKFHLDWLILKYYYIICVQNIDTKMSLKYRFWIFFKKQNHHEFFSKTAWLIAWNFILKYDGNHE